MNTETVNPAQLAAAHGSLSHVQITPDVATGMEREAERAEIQTFKAEGVTLFCGDVLDIAPRLSAVDAVVTDPPFAMAGGLSNGVTSSADTQFFEHWFSDVARHLIRLTKPEGCMFVWCDWRTVAVIERALARASVRYEPWRVSQMIVHDREMIGMGSPFRNQCDWVAVVRGQKTDFGERIAKTTPNIFREYSYYGKHDNHPAEKTVTSAERFVKWAAAEGGTILDTFMGSGTTGVACVRQGRRFVGIEKDPVHFATAVERIKHEMALGADLFGRAGGGGRGGSETSPTEAKENAKLSDREGGAPE